jgi:mono/diheme cytochrome c family protein
MGCCQRIERRHASDIRRTLLALALIVAVVPAASGGQPMSFYGFDPAAYSPEARQGLEEIFAGHIFNFAIPAQTARVVLRGQSAAFARELGVSPDSEAAWFYGFGRLPSPPDRQHGADPSFGLGESTFERDGKAMANINCFSCHAGVVRGQVVAGMGNSHINQSAPGKTRTRGDNFGPYEVWRLGTRLADPENEGMTLATGRTDLQKLMDGLQLPPVDPMPWWNMKYKRLNYWYGDGGSHSPENFSINFTVPHPEMNARRAEHVQIVSKALAFARETQSPIYPEPLDGELVRQGADLFHGRVKPAETSGFRTCSGCHGTYTRKESAPDLSQPGSWTVAYDYSDVLRNVGTDPAYNETLQQLKPVADHINKLATYFEKRGQKELAPRAAVPDKPGYVAPPLVGIWASAPYFHNGSVPTIEAVLNSEIRPEIWARNNRDPYAYDLEQVGLAHRPVTREEYQSSEAAASGKPFFSTAAIEHSTLYDTRAFGHGNTGHTFGDNLTPAERAAIIEFLKSLSGPDM